ncbi:MAG: hypothetical protein GY835_09275 [bacterium]|nr:hypothetical protein [bacterium]
MENEVFHIDRQTNNYGTDFDGYVADLFIRVDAPQMLSILIVEKWDEDDETTTREVSYCGRFSIEWSVEDAEPLAYKPIVDESAA